MDAIKTIILEGAESILDAFGLRVESHSRVALSFFVEKLNTFSSDIWNEPFIVFLMQFISTVGFGVFVYSLLLLLADIAKQSDTACWKTITITLMEAIVYCNTIVYIGMLIFSLADAFVLSFNFNIDTNQFSLGDQFFGSSMIQMLLITAIMAVFFVMSYYRIACMIVHLIASVFYIPFIVRGDTEKIFEWLTTTFSIGATYIIQMIAMYTAISFWLEGKLNMAIIFGFVCFAVAVALQKFGYTTGAKSGMGAITRSAGAMFQGAKLLMR